jgi:hypothetical protein
MVNHKLWGGAFCAAVAISSILPSGDMDCEDAHRQLVCGMPAVKMDDEPAQDMPRPQLQEITQTIASSSTVWLEARSTIMLTARASMTLSG